MSEHLPAGRDLDATLADALGIKAVFVLAKGGEPYRDSYRYKKLKAAQERVYELDPDGAVGLEVMQLTVPYSTGVVESANLRQIAFERGLGWVVVVPQDADQYMAISMAGCASTYDGKDGTGVIIAEGPAFIGNTPQHALALAVRGCPLGIE